VIKDIYSVQKLNYCDRIDNLKTEIQLTPEETNQKNLPIYLGKDNERYLFKPLSKTKPFCNDLYAIAEVYCSRIIQYYFSSETPVYTLAVCDGLSNELPNKFDKGNLVKLFTLPEERFMSFAEYFQRDESSEPHHLVKDFTNYCMMWYDFTPFFEDSTFKDNPDFSDKLASLVLHSLLFEDSNFHYGNAGFIVDGENNIIDVAPCYDNEFSFIFTSLDNPNQRVNSYKAINFGTGHNRKTNIDYLLQNKQSSVNDFLEGVISMVSDLDKLRNFSKIPVSDNFVENSDSEMWEVYSLKKKGKNLEAGVLEEKLKTRDSNIDLNLPSISEHIFKSQLSISHRILSEFQII